MQDKFASLFAGAEQQLRILAMHLTRDEELAKDLFQETAYKAFRKQYLFREGTNVNAWLATIMRNTFINDQRRIKLRRRIQEDTGIVDQVIIPEKQTRNRGITNLEIQEIQLALGRLEEKERSPLLLQAEGYKYEEIAEELALPLGTVKSRIHLARKKLNKYITTANRVGLYPDVAA